VAELLNDDKPLILLTSVTLSNPEFHRGQAV